MQMTDMSACRMVWLVRLTRLIRAPARQLFAARSVASAPPAL